MLRNLFVINSSHGDLTVDCETGWIVERRPDFTLNNIKKFDVEEWKKTYPTEVLTGMQVDILDFGYWLKNGEYYDWRVEFVELSRKNKRRK